MRRSYLALAIAFAAPALTAQSTSADSGPALVAGRAVRVMIDGPRFRLPSNLYHDGVLARFGRDTLVLVGARGTPRALPLSRVLTLDVAVRRRESRRRSAVAGALGGAAGGALFGAFAASILPRCGGGAWFCREHGTVASMSAQGAIAFGVTGGALGLTRSPWVWQRIAVRRPDTGMLVRPGRDGAAFPLPR